MVAAGHVCICRALPAGGDLAWRGDRPAGAVTQALTGAHMPTQLDVAWLSIIPVASARSSYNGLLVFVFIAASASLAALTIHRLASHALRRAPAWDCGFPDSRPETQYTGASFAQPIRRVYGTVVFRTHETVTMPQPGDIAPAR